MNKDAVDRIIGVSAILISLITLIMFIHQTRIMHKQNRLSVMPRLGFTTSINMNDSTMTYATVLKNKGIGPAIIHSSKIEYKGTTYETEMSKFLNMQFPDLEKMGTFVVFNSISDGTAISEGESRTVFSYEFTQDKMVQIGEYIGVQAEEDELPFNVIIEYASIYDEKWRTTTNDRGHPVKLK